VDGSLEGTPGTCIAVSCTPGDFAECRGDNAVTCDAGGTTYNITTCEHGCDAVLKGCIACLDNSQCPDVTPTCDAVTHACRACSVDADCTSQICDASAGTCHDGASVIYSSPTGATSGTCGDLGHECSLAHAFDLISPAKTAIRLASGDYAPVFVAVTGKTVTLFGAGATLFVEQSPSGIQVVGGGRLIIRGLKVSLAGDASAAITCQTDTSGISNLDLDRLTSVGGQAGTPVVSSQGCDVAITNSQFNSVGTSVTGVKSTNPVRVSSISVDRTTFTVTTLQGNVGSSDTSLIRVSNSLFFDSGVGGDVRVDFSTLIDTAVGCLAPAPIFTNSVLFARTAGDVIGFGGCTLDYCLITPQAVNHAMTNSKLGVDPMFASPSTNDYHLTAGSPAVDAANPASADAIDLDGPTRPQGGASDMGAFELH
jgi:hypothetical protein